jgi:uncharacterized membrane protein YeiH
MISKTDQLLFVVDMAGTLVFGIEGATAAVAGNLDYFGVLVLGFATALGGGIVRDLLIGAIPPASIRDWRYPAMAFTGAGVVIIWHSFVALIPSTLIMVLDAAGLGLFAVAGAGKALAFGLEPLLCVLMGTITGVGGGTIRDIMLARVPNILRQDIYAVAALVGSAVMIAGMKMGKPRRLMAAAGGAVCFLLRVISVWQHWNLPRVGEH